MKNTEETQGHVQLDGQPCRVCGKPVPPSTVQPRVHSECKEKQSADADKRAGLFSAQVTEEQREVIERSMLAAKKMHDGGVKPTRGLLLERICADFWSGVPENVQRAVEMELEQGRARQMNIEDEVTT